VGDPFATMTERQRVAYRAPCARAADTLRPDFARVVPSEGARWTTILSVNK
jgi:hypothetical protein